MWRGGSSRSGCGSRDRRCGRAGSSGGRGCDRCRRLDGRAERETCGVQAAQRLVERDEVALLRVVGEQRGHVVVLRAQDVLDEAVQGLLRAHLDEHACAGVVQRLHAPDELDRGGDLLAEDLDHGVDGRVGRVELAGHVRHDRALGRLDVKATKHPLQRLGRGRHDRGVEGVADRDAGGGDAGRGERLDGPLDGLGLSADDGLAVAVDVGDDDVAVRGVDDLLDLLQRTEHSCHGAVVADVEAGHLVPTGCDSLECGGERQRAGRDQRPVLTQAVAHHHVRSHAVGVQHAGHRQVGRQYGRLSDLGLQKLLVELLDRGRVVGVDEDVGRQRATQDRRHHRVSLGERLGDDGVLAAQLIEHVHVLRALAGVEEGDLGRRSATNEDSLRAKHLEHRSVVRGERLQRLVGLLGEVGRVGVVDRETHGSVRQSRVGCRHRGSGSCSSVGGHRGELGHDLGIGRPPEHQRAAQRGLGRGRGRGGGGCSRSGLLWHGGGGERPRGRLLLQTSWDVLLHHDVEVGATEAERADPGPAHAVRSGRPLAKLGVDAEGTGVPVDVGVGRLEVEARYEHLVVEAADGLEEAGGAGGSLEMADVGLHRAEPDGARLSAGFEEDLVQRRELGSVAHAGRRAVRLDVARRCRVCLGGCPRPLDGDLLTDRVGRRDALALSVRRSRDATNDGVDVLAVPLGVGQPAQDEERRTFAHDEAVGARVERPRACGREGADLAELHERRHAHVAVDAAGDDRVVGVALQALDSRGHSGEPGRAGRVSREVGSAEVEQRRDPPGDDVGQLAGHRVFGDRETTGEELLPGLSDEGLAGSRWHRLHGIGRSERLEELGGLDTQVRLVVLLAADRVADDHGDAFGVDSPVREPGIHQCHARPGHRPLLADVELLGHLGWDGQAPRHRVPVELTHPAPDGGVRLVGGRRVGVVVQRRVPPLRRCLGDAVPALPDVAPEGVRTGGVGHDRPDSDDGDGHEGVVGHVGDPQAVS